MEQLHSDHRVIAEVCKLLGIYKSCTTPYHPQSDGTVELFNFAQYAGLNCTFLTGRANFDPPMFDVIWFAYKASRSESITSVHPTTEYTPLYLMYGRQVPMPIDMFGRPSPHTAPSKYADDLHKQLEKAYQHKCGNKWAIKVWLELDMFI